MRIFVLEILNFFPGFLKMGTFRDEVSLIHSPFGLRHESNKWIWLAKGRVSKGNLRTVHESHLNSSSILFATLKCIFSLHACSCWTSKECFSVILETSSFKLHLYMNLQKCGNFWPKNLCDHEIWSYFSLKKAFFCATGQAATQAFLVSFEAQRCDGLKGDAFEGEDDANIAI